MINLLHHAKLVTCIISIIINVPTIAVAKLYTKQIDLTSDFVTTAALLCKHVIVNNYM